MPTWLTKQLASLASILFRCIPPCVTTYTCLWRSADGASKLKSPFPYVRPSGKMSRSQCNGGRDRPCPTSTTSSSRTIPRMLPWWRPSCVAQRLRDAGLRPFLAQQDLLPGEEWIPALERAIAASTTVAVFLGARGVDGWHAQQSQLALALGAEQHSRRVIPVVLPGARREELAGFLGLRVCIDLTDPIALDRLVAGITGRAPRTAHRARPRRHLVPPPLVHHRDPPPVARSIRAAPPNRSTRRACGSSRHAWDSGEVVSRGQARHVTPT